MKPMKNRLRVILFATVFLLISAWLWYEFHIPGSTFIRFHASNYGRLLVGLESDRDIVGFQNGKIYYLDGSTCPDVCRGSSFNLVSLAKELDIFGIERKGNRVRVMVDTWASQVPFIFSETWVEQIDGDIIISSNPWSP